MASIIVKCNTFETTVTITRFGPLNIRSIQTRTGLVQGDDQESSSWFLNFNTVAKENSKNVFSLSHDGLLDVD